MSFIPIYILILAFTIIVNYTAGIFIEKNSKSKKFFFLMGILGNIGVLGFFKYYNFINENLISLANLFGLNYPLPLLSIILPVGLSFHTFQAMSYNIEVYRGKFKAEKDFITFATYVMFFPQLVAGPIERPQNLIHQFKEEHKFDYQKAINGIQLMVWGFFKKLVIADRLALVVNYVYASPTDYTGTPLMLAVFFFTFQIYCDFSGYTDIARGAARVMGFELMLNFKRPFSSKSVAEFWNKWHISLSSWFQDYVFIPLYSFVSRVKLLKEKSAEKKHWISFVISIFIGEVLLGLWHGANWTFVLFGAYYGILIPLYYISRKYWNKLNPIIAKTLTFILVIIGFVFFRANSINEVLYIITHMFSGINLNLSKEIIGIDQADLILSFIFIGFMETIQFIQEKIGIKCGLNKIPRFLRWIIYIGLVLMILLFGILKGETFIYFQF